MSPETSQALLSVAAFVLELVKPVLAVVVPTLLTLWYRRWAKKHNIQLTQEQMVILDKLAAKGAAVAEEKAFDALKNKGVKLSPESKLGEALKFVDQNAALHGMKDLGQDQLVGWVLAHLGAQDATPEEQSKLEEAKANIEKTKSDKQVELVLPPK